MNQHQVKAEFSDITIILGNGTLLTNKLALVNISTYFKAAILGGFLESDKPEIIIPEFITRECFQTLINLSFNLEFKIDFLITSLYELVKASNYLGMIPAHSSLMRIKIDDLKLDQILIIYSEICQIEAELDLVLLTSPDTRVKENVYNFIASNFIEIFQAHKSLLKVAFTGNEYLSLLEHTINYFTNLDAIEIILKEVTTIRNFANLIGPSNNRSSKRIINLLYVLRNNSYKKFLKKIDEKESQIIYVDAQNLSAEGIKSEMYISTQFAKWLIKVRVDSHENLGIYMTLYEVNNFPYEHIASVLNFFSVEFNFQIANLTKVYEDCGVFSFPKNWKFLFGPSKCVKTNIILSMFPEGQIPIKIWIFDTPLHSATMHYLSIKFDEEVEKLESIDYMYLPKKDVQSLLESDKLRTKSEDKVLLFVEEFIKYNIDEGYDDIISSIRFPYVSSNLLLNCWEYSVIGKNNAFLRLLLSELQYRRNLPRYCLKSKTLVKTEFQKDQKSYNELFKKNQEAFNNEYSDAISNNNSNSYIRSEKCNETKENNGVNQLPCPSFEANKNLPSEAPSELDPYILKIIDILYNNKKASTGTESKENCKKADQLDKQEKMEEGDRRENNENRNLPEMSDLNNLVQIRPELLANPVVVNTRNIDFSFSNIPVSSFNEVHPREYSTELSCRDKLMYILNKCIGKGLIQMKNTCLQNKINRLKAENEEMKKLILNRNEKMIIDSDFEDKGLIKSKAFKCRINISSDEDNNKEKFGEIKEIKEIKDKPIEKNEKENRRSSKKRIKCKAKHSLYKKKQI